MSETEAGFFRRVADRTRKAPLALGVAITGALFAWKYVGEYPDWGPGLDFKEHADHPAPALAGGFVVSMASELRHSSASERTCIGLSLTLVAALAVEAGVLGPNTPSVVDMAYTISGGTAGTLCVKSAQQMNEQSQF